MDFSTFLSNAVDFIWGLPLLGFLLIANVILIFHSKFIPLKGFIHAFKLDWKEKI
jgi:Na+/alanine symporter